MRWEHTSSRETTPAMAPTVQQLGCSCPHLAHLNILITVFIWLLQCPLTLMDSTNPNLPFSISPHFLHTFWKLAGNSFLFIYSFILFIFGDRLSLCSPSCPGPCRHLLTSASPGLVLQLWAITPSCELIFCQFTVSSLPWSNLLVLDCMVVRKASPFWRNQ